MTRHYTYNYTMECTACGRVFHETGKLHVWTICPVCGEECKVTYQECVEVE